MSLTGRFNLKRTWRGRLCLEVEEDFQSLWGGEKRRWRKGSLNDLAEPEMRALIDLRSQRQFRHRLSVPVAPVVQPATLPDVEIAVPSVTTDQIENEHNLEGG